MEHDAFFECGYVERELKLNKPRIQAQREIVLQYFLFVFRNYSIFYILQEERTLRASCNRIALAIIVWIAVRNWFFVGYEHRGKQYYIVSHLSSVFRKHCIIYKKKEHNELQQDYLRFITFITFMHFSWFRRIEQQKFNSRKVGCYCDLNT